MRIKLRKGLMALIIILLLPGAFLWRKLVFRARLSNNRTALKPNTFAATQHQRAAELAVAIEWLRNRLPPQLNCLSIALAGQWTLRLFRVRTNIHIGVRKEEDNQLESHAWLIHNDFIIAGGSINQEFSEIWQSPKP